MIELLQYEFMRNALLAGLLASIACGIVGVYVVVNRVVFISGGISHASFGGIGLGYLVGIDPILGAIFFSLGSAIGIGIISKRTKHREDTTIGIFWAVGMALGIIFIGLSPGYAPDLWGYLFGNILTVPYYNIVSMFILDIFIIFIVLLFYKEFLALTFDEEFATVSGIPTEYLFYLLLCLIALTVVILIKIVGIILVVALLTIPATIAGQFTYNQKKMMVLAGLFGIAFIISGLTLSYFLNLSSGATIIIVSAVAFLLFSLYSKVRK